MTDSPDRKVIRTAPVKLELEVTHHCVRDGVSATIKRTYGRLAQLGEHLPYKQRVIGSSPISPTMPSQRHPRGLEQRGLNKVPNRFCGV